MGEIFTQGITFKIIVNKSFDVRNDLIKRLLKLTTNSLYQKTVKTVDAIVHVI